MKDKESEIASKIFSVPDFVGDACKAIASRIRGAVAGVQFDDFHKVRERERDGGCVFPCIHSFVLPALVLIVPYVVIIW